MYRTALHLLNTALLAALLASCGPQAVSSPPLDPNDQVAPGPDGDILRSSDLPEPMAQPLAGDPLGVTIHRLKNGLTVYLSTDRSEPRFAAWIAVRAGSRHDPPDSTGLAHYLEHMLFKGTDELGTTDAASEKPHVDRVAALYDQLRATPATADGETERARILSEIDSETQKMAKYAVPNEFDQLYARMGVRGVNAFTSNDQTVYIVDVPANRLEQWARVEGERFRDPVFRLFYPELETVYEEKNRSMDRPISRILEAMSEAVFPGHPYGTQPTIGVVDHLKSPAYADMVAYYQRWYAPNNMAIALAGDIDAATALPILEKYFGDMPARKLPETLHGELRPLSGKRQLDMTANGESAVYMAWQTVATGHRDEAALEAMDLLMDNAASGLINVELVLSQRLPDAGSFARNLREAGMWLLYGTARQGQDLAEVEGLLRGVIGKLKAGDFTQADLDAIVLHAQMREMRELESNISRVAKMTDAFINHLPWSEAARRSERLRKVTRDEVIAAANKYLGDDHVVLYRKNGEHAPPKIPKPTITPISIDPSKKSAYAGTIESMSIGPLEPEWLREGTHYERRALPSGELLAVQNKMSELFALEYRFEVGSRKQKLLCFALDLMKQAGTISLTPEALQRKLYALGTRVVTSCGPDQVRLSVMGIDRNMEASIGLLTDWLRTAKLTDDLYKKLLANEISQRKDDMDDPGNIGQALSSYAARASNSRYLLIPSNKQLQSARLPQLRALLGQLTSYQHRTSYFGPRSADDAAGAVVLGKQFRPLAKRPPATYRKVRGARIFFLHKEVAQSNISIVLPKAPLPAPDIARARLYNEYIGGGMGALIFQEIREARGLAYSARGFHVDGQRPSDQSAVFGLMGTQSDKTLEALGTMLELIRNMPVQPSRLAIAKTSLDAEYRSSRVAPRRVASRVIRWQERGFDSDPGEREWRTISGLTEADLEAFARRFADGPVIISILGDRNRIDMKALAKIAPVTEVRLGQVFGY